VNAVNDYLLQRNSTAKCERINEFPGFYKVVYPPRTQSLSVVIPTAFKVNHLNLPLLMEAVSSISEQLNQSDELIIVSGENEDKGFMPKVANLTKANVIHVIDDSEFNFSRRVNLGCLAATKHELLVLNDDVEFLSRDALNQMSGLLKEDGVGLIGCLLLFPDGKVQHGGHIYHGAHAHHAHYLSTSITNNFGDLIVDREVSGVTGAVMYQNRSTWESVGGFTHFLPGNYNDVDYCLKVRNLGLSIVQANSVWANHKESATRNSELHAWEVELVNLRWGHLLERDRYTRIFE
jgi:GT2 family glycosyltransferase